MLSITHFFVLPLLLSLSLLHHSSASDDGRSLNSFKSALPHPPPSQLSNWVPTQDPCSFNGVECDSTSRRVTSVDLSFIPLTVDFHSVALFLLSIDSLESLSLKSVNLSGSLAFPFRSKCSSVLVSLDLSENAVSGPVSDIANLAGCSALKALNLSGNGFDFVVKGKWIGLKLGLESLDLSWNKISGFSVVGFLIGGGCSDLKLMSIRGNKVAAGEVDVFDCRNLEFLDVSSNNFSGDVPNLGGCDSLQHLDISGNKFSGDLGRSVFPCSKLSFLNASANLFSGQIPRLNSPGGNRISLPDSRHARSLIQQSLRRQLAAGSVGGAGWLAAAVRCLGGSRLRELVGVEDEEGFGRICKGLN